MGERRTTTRALTGCCSSITTRSCLLYLTIGSSRARCRGCSLSRSTLCCGILFWWAYVRNSDCLYNFGNHFGFFAPENVSLRSILDFVCVLSCDSPSFWTSPRLLEKLKWLLARYRFEGNRFYLKMRFLQKKWNRVCVFHAKGPLFWASSRLKEKLKWLLARYRFEGNCFYLKKFLLQTNWNRVCFFLQWSLILCKRQTKGET